MEHSNFKDVFLEAWNTPQYKTDPSMWITAKLKIARKHLKEWQKELPKLAQFIDIIEEHRDLEVQELNFRRLWQQHLTTLLDWQKNILKTKGGNKVGNPRGCLHQIFSCKCYH
jgi:diadenosine tetraphosphatase ApaH/serine/threonine PP2A family protein phosphatase